MTLSRLFMIAFVGLCFFAVLVSSRSPSITMNVLVHLSAIAASAYYVKRYWDDTSPYVFAMVSVNALVVGIASALMVIRLCN